MRFYIDVRADGVLDALRRTAVEMQDLRPAARALAIQGALIARARAPRRTGRLRSSIRGSFGRNASYVDAGGRARDYAGVINYGWRQHNIEADHFMRQTAGVLRVRAPRLYSNAIADTIRRTGLK